MVVIKFSNNFSSLSFTSWKFCRLITYVGVIDAYPHYIEK